MLLTLLLTLALQAPTLTVSPRFSPEPVTLTLTVGKISGYIVCAGVDGVEYGTSTCRENPRTTEQFVFKNVPADTYFARAIVCASPTNCKVSPTVEVVVTSTGER